jgi:hypothetical protein
MNWFFIPVLVVYLYIIYRLREKAKLYIIIQIVQSQILKNIPDPTEVAIQGYNLVASFILLPIFFLGWAMLFGNIPYTYDWTYSIIAYASTLLAL